MRPFSKEPKCPKCRNLMTFKYMPPKLNGDIQDTEFLRNFCTKCEYQEDMECNTTDVDKIIWSGEMEWKIHANIAYPCYIDGNIIRFNSFLGKKGRLTFEES